jgi:hypothetical protein
MKGLLDVQCLLGICEAAADNGDPKELRQVLQITRRQLEGVAGQLMLLWDIGFGSPAS